jgi:hypothetical protein
VLKFDQGSGDPTYFEVETGRFLLPYRSFWVTVELIGRLGLVAVSSSENAGGRYKRRAFSNLSILIQELPVQNSL